MSLPDVSFTNNLGTIDFRRCLISATDNWAWNGRAVRFTKTVNIDGWVKQDGISPEGLEAILTDPSIAARGSGQMGDLILPWTILHNVKITNVDYPTGIWINYQKISVTFSDDYPDNNNYTLSFFGTDLHNPRITISAPLRPLNDQYPQMNYGLLLLPTDVRFGVMRTKGSYNMMEVVLAGTAMVDNGILDQTLIDKLSQRTGFGGIYSTVSPTGWPNPIRLGDACPEISADANLAQCIIYDGRLVWNVEQQSVAVSVNMLAPPQELGS